MTDLILATVGALALLPAALEVVGKAVVASVETVSDVRDWLLANRWRSER